MREAKRLWRTLEAVPGPSTSRMEWAALLGDDLTLLEPFLRPTGEVAASYPCPNPARPGSRHRVIEHGPDDLVGVCDDGCAPEPLRRSELLIYEAAADRLAEVLADALNITFEDRAPSSDAQTPRIGIYSPTAGYRFPIYLTLQIEPQELHGALTHLVAENEGPFILIAPTHDLRSPDIDALLEKKPACFLAMADLFRVGPDGQLQPMADPEVVLSSFRDAALPSEDEAFGRVFFRTPPDAAWEDVSIKFKDRHTASVSCGRVRGVFHYSQIGMADGRNASPTKQWDLLYSFAEGHGIIDWEHSDADRRNQKRRENLALDLQAFFRIEGDPIEYDAESKGWRARFGVEPD